MGGSANATGGAHGPPKIVDIIAKGFDDVQLRWSAMERELFALWKGVVGLEKLIKGFPTYVYMDHKNNLFFGGTVGQSTQEQEDVELGTGAAAV